MSATHLLITHVIYINYLCCVFGVKFFHNISFMCTHDVIRLQYIACFLFFIKNLVTISTVYSAGAHGDVPHPNFHGRTIPQNHVTYSLGKLPSHPMMEGRRLRLVKETLLPSLLV